MKKNNIFKVILAVAMCVALMMPALQSVVFAAKPEEALGVMSVSEYGTQNDEINFKLILPDGVDFYGTVFDYGFVENAAFQEIVDMLSINGQTLREINDSTSYIYTNSYPQLLGGIYGKTIIVQALPGTPQALHIRVHQDFAAANDFASGFSFTVNDNFSVELTDKIYTVDKAYTWDYDGSVWKYKAPEEALGVLSVSEYGTQNDEINFKLILPDGVDFYGTVFDYGFVENAAFQGIVDMLSINGQTLREINDSTSYTYTDSYPQLLGGNYGKTIIVQALPGTPQALHIRVHQDFAAENDFASGFSFAVNDNFSVELADKIYTVDKTYTWKYNDNSTWSDIKAVLTLESAVQTVDVSDIADNTPVLFMATESSVSVLKNSMLYYSVDGGNFRPMVYRKGSVVYETGAFASPVSTNGNESGQQAWWFPKPAGAMSVTVKAVYVNTAAMTSADYIDSFGASIRQPKEGVTAGLRFGTRALREYNGNTLKAMGTMLIRKSYLDANPCDGDWQAWANAHAADLTKDGTWRNVQAASLMDRCDAYVDWSVRIVNIPTSSYDTEYIAVGWASYFDASGNRTVLFDAQSSVSYDSVGN